MPNHRIAIFFPVFALLLFVPGVRAAAVVAPGVPNFHQVNDLIYRGGQPTTAGWQSLAKLGVKTVIDLCDEHPPAIEQRAVEAAGMKFVSVPMNGNGIGEPSAKLIAKVLGLLESTTTPVFIHCQHGSDRTGTVIACYRIDHDHWDQAKALKEADTFGMSWINVGMKRYIRDYAPRPAIAAVAAPLAGSE